MKRIAALVLFLLGLATLLALGTWQYQRLHWKNGIITALEEQYTFLPQKSATLTRSRIETALAGDPNPFLADKVSGPLLREKAVFVGPRPLNNQIGYDVVVPVEMGDGLLLVNLGWVDQDRKDMLSLPRRIVAGGVARKPDYSSFASQNSPENNLWFRTDVAQIAAAKDLPPLPPLVLYVQDKLVPDITPHDAHWLPRNKHRQYMFFWFGMACAWVAVFALAARRYRQG